jgi:hypothetical protein
MSKDKTEMRPFPGKLKRIGPLYVLTGWQGRWMREYYPKNFNKDIAIAIGISESTVYQLAKRYELEKDEEWLYYERCKKIGRHKGCADEHNIAKQKTHTITIATKLSPRDYKLLCYVAKKNKKNKYEYLQDIVRKALKAEEPFKEGKLL